jgi:flagellar M-ring protein FliF
MADIVPAAPRSLMQAGPVMKQVGLLAGVAAAVAVAVWLVLWSQGQNYSVLYGCQSGKAGRSWTRSPRRASNTS